MSEVPLYLSLARFLRTSRAADNTNRLCLGALLDPSRARSSEANVCVEAFVMPKCCPPPFTPYRTRFSVKGYLAHKKPPAPYNHHRALGIGPL